MVSRLRALHWDVDNNVSREWKVSRNIIVSARGVVNTEAGTKSAFARPTPPYFAPRRPFCVDPHMCGSYFYRLHNRAMLPACRIFAPKKMGVECAVSSKTENPRDAPYLHFGGV